MPSRTHSRRRIIKRTPPHPRQMFEHSLQFVWLSKNVAQEMCHQGLTLVRAKS
jgi:hypothetical protein